MPTPVASFDAVYCAIWRKIHGFEGAARPIITASQPVASTMAAASSGRADVAVADHRDADRIGHRGDVLPSSLAGVAILARASVQRNGVQAAVLRQLRQLDADNVLVVPSHADLHRKRDRHSGPDSLKDRLDQRQIAQQAGAAIAGHDPLRRAAEVQIDQVEARILRQCAPSPPASPGSTQKVARR